MLDFWQKHKHAIGRLVVNAILQGKHTVEWNHHHHHHHHCHHCHHRHHHRHRLIGDRPGPGSGRRKGGKVQRSKNRNRKRSNQITQREIIAKQMTKVENI